MIARRGQGALVRPAIKSFNLEDVPSKCLPHQPKTLLRVQSFDDEVAHEFIIDHKLSHPIALNGFDVKILDVRRREIEYARLTIQEILEGSGPNPCPYDIGRLQGKGYGCRFSSKG